MMKTPKISILLLCASALLTSCSNKGWSVQGTVSNAADGQKVAVEGFNAGYWYNIDSVALGSDGRFAYTSPSGSQYPDIYRLSLDGRSIYFPIDSLESITIVADAASFDTEYTVSGWALAEQMADIDKRISREVAEKGQEAVLNDSTLRRELGEVINNDENGMLGYYVINKTIGDKPLFSPLSKDDLRIYGALANKFSTKYPDDPRTEYLVKIFLQGRANQNPEAMSRVIEANEAGIFEIELYDAKGNKRKLTEVADGGVTLLSFTSYQIEASVPYNVELNRLMEKYPGLKIYQVSVDDNELQWRTSAANLPWTAVWYDAKDGGALLRTYNVQAVPITYIIDSNGDLVERVLDPTDLETALRKYL